MAFKSPTALMGLEHYVYRRDGKVYVYRVGDGDPIVFLHSVGTHGASWKRVIDELSRHFACYVIDMPGHDHFDIPPRKYTLDDYADAVVDVMDAIGLKQTNMMGDHTGAMISVIVAVQHPERVKRLVLDGLPYWNKEQGQVIWERWFSPMYTDTTSYHVPVTPLITWEEAKAKTPDLDREAGRPETLSVGRAGCGGGGARRPTQATTLRLSVARSRRQRCCSSGMVTRCAVRRNWPTRISRGPSTR